MPGGQRASNTHETEKHSKLPKRGWTQNRKGPRHHKEGGSYEKKKEENHPPNAGVIGERDNRKPPSQGMQQRKGIWSNKKAYEGKNSV